MFKAPWRDGITHQIMTPLDFLQRLTALVPRPRLHLIKLHEVLPLERAAKGAGGAAGV